MQTQGVGRMATLTKSHEEQVRILRQTVAEQKEQLGEQMQSLNASLEELVESKITLERRMQELVNAIEEKNSELVQYKEVAEKLKSQRDLADKKGAEEKSRSQSLHQEVEWLGEEKIELQAELDRIGKQLKGESIDRGRLERDLKAQQDTVRDLHARHTATEAERARLEKQ